jgi:hypothetical protein
MIRVGLDCESRLERLIRSAPRTIVVGGDDDSLLRRQRMIGAALPALVGEVR